MFVFSLARQSDNSHLSSEPFYPSNLPMEQWFPNFISYLKPNMVDIISYTLDRFCQNQKYRHVQKTQQLFHYQILTGPSSVTRSLENSLRSVGSDEKIPSVEIAVRSGTDFDSLPLSESLCFLKLSLLLSNRFRKERENEVITIVFSQLPRLLILRGDITSMLTPTLATAISKTIPRHLFKECSISSFYRKTILCCASGGVARRNIWLKNQSCFLPT